jgi:hypothetical protein
VDRTANIIRNVLRYLVVKSVTARVQMAHRNRQTSQSDANLIGRRGSAAADGSDRRPRWNSGGLLRDRKRKSNLEQGRQRRLRDIRLEEVAKLPVSDVHGFSYELPQFTNDPLNVACIHLGGELYIAGMISQLRSSMPTGYANRSFFLRVGGMPATDSDQPRNTSGDLRNSLVGGLLARVSQKRQLGLGIAIQSECRLKAKICSGLKYGKCLIEPTKRLVEMGSRL